MPDVGFGEQPQFLEVLSHFGAGQKKGGGLAPALRSLQEETDQ
jgi:hypothetical protein